MTIIDSPAPPEIDNAQLLFQEAKERRKRRWVISGVVAALVVAVLALTLGLSIGRNGQGPSRPLAVPGLITAAGAHPVAELSFRPVLCYAPAFTLAGGQVASTGALPPCSASTQLNASNLAVEPNAQNVNGYTSETNIQPDPQFVTYPSTATSNVTNGATVLVPGVSALGSTRYVLGPAALTQNIIQKADATLNSGQWAVNLDLTAQGSTEWDTLTLHQFHQIIGVVLNGKVISAPITQPTQASWTSFNGQVQISGSFTEAQAKALAAEL